MSLLQCPVWARGTSLVVLGVLTALALFQPLQGLGQQPLTRPVKSRVAPVYPDMARRMRITGTVRMVVVVSRSGRIKTIKLVGGHPILVSAAMDALKKWKFEPASDESAGLVEFKFQPSD